MFDFDVVTGPTQPPRREPDPEPAPEPARNAAPAEGGTPRSGS